MGRVTNTYSPYGHDTDISDSSIATVHAANLQSKSTRSYVVAGNVKTQTVGHGTSSALATTYTYDARSRNKTTTSPSGGVSTSYFDDCCGNISGSKDHFGEGSVRVADTEGRTVYQAAVKDFDFVAGTRSWLATEFHKYRQHLPDQ